MKPNVENNGEVESTDSQKQLIEESVIDRGLRMAREQFGEQGRVA